MTQVKAVQPDESERPTGSRPGRQPGGPALGRLREGRSRASVAGVAWTLANVLMGAGISALVCVVASRVLAPGGFAPGIVMVLSCLVPFGLTPGGIRAVQEMRLDPFLLGAIAGPAAPAVRVLAHRVVGRAEPQPSGDAVIEDATSRCEEALAAFVSGRARWSAR